MANPAIEEIEEEAKKIRSSIEKSAKIKGWKLNENAAVADSVINGLARNQIIHGKRYCPCRIVSDDAEANKAHICPCKDSDVDVERDGHCHCYLFCK